MKRKAWHFRVPESVFRFALFLDAQRWTESRHVKSGMIGYRSSLIRFLKQYCNARAFPNNLPALASEPIVYWMEWHPRPAPRWSVRIYGMIFGFDRYMTSTMVAQSIHDHHTNVKGTRHWWCLICNPQRGGTFETIGALEAADEMLNVVELLRMVPP